MGGLQPMIFVQIVLDRAFHVGVGKVDGHNNNTNNNSYYPRMQAQPMASCYILVFQLPCYLILP